MKTKVALSGLSLFAGAGGMDVGFARAGIQVVGANEIDRDACLTYAANHPGVTLQPGDLNQQLDTMRQFEGG